MQVRGQGLSRDKPGPGSRILLACHNYKDKLGPSIDFNLRGEGNTSSEIMGGHTGAVPAGQKNAVDGKKLAYPTLFEHHNKHWEDKSHLRTMALYRGDEALPEEMVPAAERAAHGQPPRAAEN